MKLYAISDLHLGNPHNRQALEMLSPHPEDWLIVAGDVGETEAQLHFALNILVRRFARVIWVPGNHDLWTLPSNVSDLRGEAKYRRLISICQEYGVATPEDPYLWWRGDDASYIIAPLFVLYDYTFRPPHVPLEKAIEWAAETGVVCTDEFLLHPDPYPSRSAWCAARCAYTERRLQEAASQASLIIVNHFPLRQDLVRLFRIPRFTLWCGTCRTEDWHTRFQAKVVVHGHLHIRATDYREGVRFEEVSLGYPQQWSHHRGIDGYLRQILPDI